MSNGKHPPCRMDKFKKGKLLVRRMRAGSDFGAGYIYHLIKFGLPLLLYVVALR